MNASKENAARALDAVLELESVGKQMAPSELTLRFEHLKAFLTSAINKLPSEAAYQREVERRKHGK